jgi:hypothetical protein
MRNKQISAKTFPKHGMRRRRGLSRTGAANVNSDNMYIYKSDFLSLAPT